MVFIIARHCGSNNDKDVIGYTLYDSKSRAKSNITYNELIKAIYNGLNVENAEVIGNKLHGTQGSLDRICAISPDGKELTRPSVIIMQKVIDGTVSYRAVNHLGREVLVRTEAILYAVDNGKYIVANAKVAPDLGYIAPIVGTFDTIAVNIDGVTDADIARVHSTPIMDTRHFGRTKYRIVHRNKAINAEYIAEKSENVLNDILYRLDIPDAIVNDSNTIFHMPSNHRYIHEKLFFKTFSGVDSYIDITEISIDDTPYFVMSTLANTFIVYDILYIDSRIHRMTRDTFSKLDEEPQEEQHVIALGLTGLVIFNINNKRYNTPDIEYNVHIKIDVIPYQMLSSVEDINSIDKMVEANISVKLTGSDIQYILGKVNQLDKENKNYVYYDRLEVDDIGQFTREVNKNKLADNKQAIYGIYMINSENVINNATYEAYIVSGMESAVYTEMKHSKHEHKVYKIHELHGSITYKRAGIYSYGPLVGFSESLVCDKYTTGDTNTDLEYLGFWAIEKVRNKRSGLITKREEQEFNRYAEILSNQSARARRDTEANNRLGIAYKGFIYVFKMDKLVELYQSKIAEHSLIETKLSLIKSKYSMIGIELLISDRGWVIGWRQEGNQAITLPKDIVGIEFGACGQGRFKPTGVLDIKKTRRVITDNNKIQLVYSKNTYEIFTQQLKLHIASCNNDSSAGVNYIVDLSTATINDIDGIISDILAYSLLYKNKDRASHLAGLKQSAGLNTAKVIIAAAKRYEDNSFIRTEADAKLTEDMMRFVNYIKAINTDRNTKADFINQVSIDIKRLGSEVISNVGARLYVKELLSRISTDILEAK